MDSALKQSQRRRRHARIRAKVRGTSVRPRLAVSKSNRYVVAQIINDEMGASLVQLTTRTLTSARGKSMLEGARELGRAVAKRAKDVGITHVVFDRGGFIYTGVVRAVADAARAEGLKL